MNTAIDNCFTSDQTAQGYKYMPTVLALPLANITSFVDTMQKIDALLYHYWKLDTIANVAYRAMEPKRFGAQNGLAVRYLFGKQVDINPNGTFTSSDVQPINVQQQTMISFYGQFIPEIISDYVKTLHTYWFAN
ncbi:MAG: hypothetical protein EZS28_029863 [Streblomastix strix]|uniref:Uncharacterized protein n=1 Tax=Streblomastix strix TaxID=222440 RepID=A0A5J4UVY4_9EUKA|nr:MAG: hypothetical protein EZS28_029863 [Streblomastix strix]